MRSLRDQLACLVKQHPDWTPKQYGAHLGQTADSIRGALSALRRTGVIKPKEIKLKAPKRRRKKTTAVPYMLSQRMGSGHRPVYAAGYLCLM